jgi:hypothetical protein
MSEVQGNDLPAFCRMPLEGLFWEGTKRKQIKKSGVMRAAALF